MKNSWYYFWMVFSAVGLGLFFGLMVFTLIMGLSEENFSFTLAFLQSLQISFGTALLLGLINIFARFDFTKKKEQP
ncbi:MULTISPECIES: hypothetical protein [unclassified Flavobacterium]|uniref:hypothetical protein n=1 Tax=unclassified Flavobacterium TaxID=196869 RepID=UPI001F13622D|nr:MULTISPECIES: hypothetical protein [unclassified Flavobacterium]UMY65014.1 hypothetical protein MKO97_10880 [Flavobacterium sp. HJ-32-4]